MYNMEHINIRAAACCLKDKQECYTIEIKLDYMPIDQLWWSDN